MARGKPARSKAKPKGKAAVRTRRRAARKNDFWSECRELYTFCTRLPVILAFGVTMGVCLGLTAAEIDAMRQATGQAPAGLVAANDLAAPESTEPDAPDIETAAGAPAPEMTEQAVAAPPVVEPAVAEPVPPPLYTEQTEPNAAPEVEIPEPEPAPMPEANASVEPVIKPVPVPYEPHEPEPVSPLPAPIVESELQPLMAEPAPPAPKSAPAQAPHVASITPAPQPKPAPAATPAPEPMPEVDLPPLPEEPLMAEPVPADAPTWLKNAVASVDPGQRPMIAIVLDDVGVAPQDAELALTLPGSITLSIMTYAPNAATLAKRAHAKGHEIMLHMPMEPVDHSVDPGPNALLVNLSEAELRRRVVWGLSQFDGYVGINNHMGSRFTQYAPGMRIVMQELKARGLLFLDSRTIATTIGDVMAAKTGVTHVSRDVFLDNTMTVAAVLRQLQDAETLARTQGYVVAIGHPHPATIAALKSWIPRARRAGFVLVPLSAIVKKREGLAG